MKNRQRAAAFFFLCLFFAQWHSPTAGAEESTVSSPIASNPDLFNPFPAGFPTAPDQPEGWVSLPPGRPFPSLISDPRDLKIGLRKNTKDELEADIGGYRSLAGWKGEIKGKETIFHTGIEGNAYFVMRQQGAKFPLMSSDGLLGIYGEAQRGLWLYQFRYTHISAHLSDDLYDKRQKIEYSREFIVLRVARQLAWFRPYVGYYYLTNSTPELQKHSAQLGFYGVAPIHWKRLHPYFGADLRIRNASEGTNFAATFGVALVSSLGAPPVRFSFNYLKGHDLRGQFFREKTDKWSFGLDLDF